MKCLGFIERRWGFVEQKVAQLKDVELPLKNKWGGSWFGSTLSYPVFSWNKLMCFFPIWSCVEGWNVVHVSVSIANLFIYLFIYSNSVQSIGWHWWKLGMWMNSKPMLTWYPWVNQTSLRSRWVAHQYFTFFLPVSHVNSVKVSFFQRFHWCIRNVSLAFNIRQTGFKCLIRVFSVVFSVKRDQLCGSWHQFLPNRITTLWAFLYFSWKQGQINSFKLVSFMSANILSRMF